MLTVLGGGGWLPAHGRHTATALMRQAESAIMIDAGTGVARLMECPELLAGVQRLDIVLTHFHLDHIAGLAYLPSLDICEETTVWGPGSLLYGTSTAELLDRVSQEPFHPVALDQQDIEVRDICQGELELGKVRMTHRRQGHHTAPTMGLRFGDELAWVTDTANDPGSVELAGGCQMLAHEAWFTEDAPRNPEIHSSAAQAAEIAAAAQVSQLLLIHLPPFTASIEAIVSEAEQRFPSVIPARDGLVLEAVGA
ncbi:MAG TPA: MBL fold metallo-hydrolase [Solirubrobacteraceae bacterium]|jgi:ribonuclease BN (tRNA processing enzyme)|nr:MBL fold metallo-hydrolase [Solirubrobacteraceae bacterium]